MLVGGLELAKRAPVALEGDNGLQRIPPNCARAHLCESAKVKLSHFHFHLRLAKLLAVFEMLF
jgi:hypothetical protein